jgi:hypothetical protein
MEKNLFILNKEVKSLGKYHKFQNYLLFETKKRPVWNTVSPIVMPKDFKSVSFAVQDRRKPHCRLGVMIGIVQHCVRLFVQKMMHDQAWTNLLWSWKSSHWIRPQGICYTNVFLCCRGCCDSREA